jgi:hypothetical protein
MVRPLVKKRLPAKAKSSRTYAGAGNQTPGLRKTRSQKGPFLRGTLRTVFGIDPRSLALFRIWMGAALLVDLSIRATDLGTMYTDGGMFPRATISHHYSTIWDWSFHFGSGAWPYQAFLFGLAAVLAVALLVGFETRLATVGSWLMLISVHHRVPPILSGADVLMRMLIFWAMFLPLGKAWSLDNWLKRSGPDNAGVAANAPVLSVGSAAILLQMALMYFFSAIFKSNASWVHGQVVAGALAHDFFGSALAPHLLGFPVLLTLITWGTLILEWAAPVLLFFPKGTARLRLWLICALAAMHLGIALSLEVDFFSPVSLAGLSLFLPAEFWSSRLPGRFFPRTEREVRTEIGPQIESRTWTFAVDGLCLLFLFYVIGNNINGLPGHPLTAEPPARKGFFSTAFGLGQKWSMFDDVPTKNGWYVAEAKLRDGTQVDLLRRGSALDWNKPSFPAGMYPNFRWRKCFREMAYTDQIGYQVFRAPVAEFLCRDWNAGNAPERQVFEFDLIYCNEGDTGGAASPQVVIREQLLHLDFSGSSSDRAIVSVF